MFGKKSEPAPGVTRVDGHLGSVDFDGRTVVINKAARGSTRIPVQQVVSVSIEPAGVGMKGIRFATAASAQVNTVAHGRHRDVATDPNALTFRSKHAAAFEALARQIEDAIHGA